MQRLVEAGPDSSTDPPTDATSPNAPGRRDINYADIIGLLVGLAALAGSIHMGVGSLRAPGPGFTPAVASGVILLGSGLTFASRKRRAHREQQSSRELILPLVILVLFVVLFFFVGALTGLLVSLFLWFRFVSRWKWGSAVVATVVLSLATYAMFVVLLGIPVPRGIGI